MSSSSGLIELLMPPSLLARRIFFGMNYSKVYMCLILNRQAHPLSKNEYGENHHIIPRSEGGSNDITNKVKLTAREHYIAHLLLAKIYDDYAMYSALTYMQTGRHKNRKFKFNSRLYAKMREEFGRKHSQHMKGRFSGDKHWNYGNHLSNEAKEKQRLAHLGQKAWNKGIPMSEESKKKLSINNGSRRLEVREKMSKAAKNRPPISDETRKKMSEAHKNPSKLARFEFGKGFRGKVWANNGIEQKPFFENEIPIGWIKGMLKKKKTEIQFSVFFIVVE